jgi:alcohol dehydrogenase (NADP+)
MEHCKDLGLAKHIGVSNFNSEKLNELISSGRIAPEMNQIELHPFLPQKKLVNFCRSNGILLTAYSPLGSGDRSASIKKPDEPSLLDNPKVLEIASLHKASPAQILIAYSIHRGIAVIPKSVNKERIAENLEASKIQLTDSDMERLDHIGTSYRYVDGSFFTGPVSPYSLYDLWEMD